MKLEKEYRYIDFDPQFYFDIAKTLGQAKFIKYKRAVYDIPGKDGWLRLRTDGKKTDLTVKISVIDDSKTSKSLEQELLMDNFDDTIKLLELIGYKARSVQTNYRIKFLIDSNVEMTFDTWPEIGTLIEIEGDSEEAIELVEKRFEGLHQFHTDKTITDLFSEKNIDVKYAENLDFKETPQFIVSNFGINSDPNK